MSIIEWRLAKLMAERGVNYKMLGEATGMHPNTISKLKHNPPTRLEMTTLVLLCRALNCQPGDLLTYTPESNGSVAVQNQAGTVQQSQKEPQKESQKV